MKTTTNPVKAIRKHCLDCVGNSSEEVRTCTAGLTCFLWPFRFGKNPYRKKLSEVERQAVSERMKKARTKSSLNGNRD